MLLSLNQGRHAPIR
jgi:hypothetical protein